MSNDIFIMSALTALTLFNDLPAEVRDRTWRAAADNEDAVNKDIVEVKMRRLPLLTRAGPFTTTRPWRLIYTYGLAARNPSPLLSTSRESRAEYLLRHQDTIQLNNGPMVHFDSERDTIHFDSESLFNLWHYVTKHRAPPSNVPLGNLRGLTAIQTLGFHHKNPMNHNIRGLANLLVPAERALCNITKIRCLGDRGHWPGGVDPLFIVPVARNKLISRLKNAQRTIVEDYERNRRVVGHPNSAKNVAQQDLFNAESININAQVTSFLTATPPNPGFGIPWSIF
ncbi:hypothetical protein N431DRAFT_86214 [Stipitochalara longipes BDJ]|nr:hypothetical protein N431DRAFT_86214 [Stipitochalara longipes BDJ]